MVKSTSSTMSGNSIVNGQNDTAKERIHNDIIRYQQKGYGLIFAVLQVLFFFLILPELHKKYLMPFLLANMEPKNLPYINLATAHISLMSINIIMQIIYENKIPFFERYRIAPNKPWPWEEKDSWPALRHRFIVAQSFDFLIQVSFVVLTTWLPIDYKYSLEDFPSKLEIAIQLTFFMLTEDFFFYWGHRLNHLPYLYKHVHKQHHEFKNPVSFASTYAHPFEFLVCNLVPFALGYIVLGKSSHFVTIQMWHIVRMLETVDGHCGYEFSWSPYRLIPFSGSANYHNYHHSHNVGNFGSFFIIWDMVFGTNKQYYIYLNNKQKADLIKQNNKKQL